MKTILLFCALMVTFTFSQAQIINPGTGPYYVGGPGLLTYVNMYGPANHNFATSAPCDTYKRYYRYQNGQQTSLPNTNDCAWVLSGAGTIFLIYKNDWSNVDPNGYDFPAENLKVRIGGINSSYLDFKVEVLDPTKCSKGSSIHINYTFSGHNTYFNPLYHDCEGDCGDDDGGDTCYVRKSIVSCGDFDCVSLSYISSGGCDNCYRVKVKFTDNSEASFEINFAQDSKIMHCYSKSIASIIDVEEIPCLGGLVGFDEKIEKTATQNENDDFSLDNVYVYPNPTNSSFEINGLGDKESKILIFDLNGEKLIEYGFQREYSISDLDSGIYIIKIFSSTDELLFNEKLIKQ